MKRIGAVILAAGASRRLGEPKQLVKIGAENLLEHSVRVAREAGFSPVVVVLGASAESIEAECELGDADVLRNDNWCEGMSASVRVGVGALHDLDGCVVMTCDMPGVTALHLRSLAASGEVAGSTYDGRRGVPAYFPASLFKDLMELRGDAGAKDLLRSAQCVALAGGELDVDTIEDLVRARELFG
ncbi:NTP transferase domain-containing protein [Tunturiibacter gelidoferens]|uniref:CTP:molybdopterin cytidylyltransferase MocA n=1 Tax=Tunturiibacter gelidiferens TaxID=3069689 RepID=A0ACC5P4V7_9BACT|nr:CTP:molybdopterin cytidylyltransferase MocA [Edaphobacter lichenicola]